MKRPTQTSTQLHTRLRRGFARAHGFTMVEILVVIGILLVLAGISAIALKGLDQSGRATKGTLSNLQNILAEYEATAGLRNQPPYVWVNGSQRRLTATPPPNVWQQEANLGGGRGIVTSDDPGGERVTWDAVANTQLVYQILNRIPANKQAMGRLPKQLLGQIDVSPPPTPKKLLPLTDAASIDPPLVLDAWGNPIVFVGRDGLRGVGADKKTGFPGIQETDFNKVGKVTTAGFVIESSSGPPTPAPAGARPFFASAGPDGNFRTHEDNLYSFDN